MFSPGCSRCCVMASAAFAQASSKPVAIIPRDADVSGVKIHYLTAGQGPAVILLHGYTQTSRMWKPIIPLLAKKFTVIAPDLPGIGDSGIPKDGLDMKTSAIRIHALAKSLGVEKARVVGHDIGLMVAYAYAAMYPNEVEKLVLMDAFLPGVAGWEPYYNNPNLWHFRFHGPTRKPWCKDVRRRISHISGMSWPRTKRGRFRSQTGRPMLRRIRVLDACAPDGRTLQRGLKPQMILPRWRRQN